MLLISKAHIAFHVLVIHKSHRSCFLILWNSEFEVPSFSFRTIAHELIFRKRRDGERDANYKSFKAKFSRCFLK